MTEPHAPALIGGPYEPPACKVGSWVMDEIHGLVQVGDFSFAPLSWPTRKRSRGGPRSLVLTEDLVLAIRLESAMAVAHWWGVSKKTVRVWRRLLDVPRNTEGTRLQHAAVAELPPADAAARGRARINAEPEIRRRIGEAQRGKAVSPETRQRLSEAHRGKPKPAEWAQDAGAWMREGKKRRRADGAG